MCGGGREAVLGLGGGGDERGADFAYFIFVLSCADALETVWGKKIFIEIPQMVCIYHHFLPHGWGYQIRFSV